VHQRDTYGPVAAVLSSGAKINVEPLIPGIYTLPSKPSRKNEYSMHQTGVDDSDDDDEHDEAIGIFENDIASDDRSGNRTTWQHPFQAHMD
jgi:hypothetical protein